MPFSSGTYSRVYTWATEALSPPIAISKLDTQEEDIASALSSCLLRDGTGLPTATIDWNAQRLTNLGAATAATDAVRASQVQGGGLLTLGSVAGTDTVTGSLTPALAAYVAHMVVKFTPANNNTGAATLNINSLGALDIQKADGDALIAGDLVAGVPAVLVLDTGADDWILLNPQASVNGIATSDLARLSQNNTFAGTGTWTANVAGAHILTVRNTNTANVSTSRVHLENDAGTVAYHLLTSNANVVPQFTGSPAAAHYLLGTSSAVALSIGTNSVERIRVAGDGSIINLQATAVQVNGQDVRNASLFNAGTLVDARVAQSNVTQHAAAVLATQNITSGTYTPTLTDTTNVSGSTGGTQSQYLRVGNVVTVSGSVSGSTSAAGQSAVGISLPVASNFTNTSMAAGAAGAVMGATGTANTTAGNIDGDVANDRAVLHFQASAAGAYGFLYTFTYLIN